MNSERKKIFTERLKDEMVNVFCSEEKKQYYFKKKASGSDVTLPHGARQSFSEKLNKYDSYPAESTITTWLNPENAAAPDADTLYAISSILGVSSDYLLGLTDKKEAYEDLYIANALGCSPVSINQLKQWGKNSYNVLLLDVMVRKGYLENIAQSILNRSETISHKKIILSDDKLGDETLDESAASDFADYMATKEMRILLDDMVNDDEISRLESIRHAFKDFSINGMPKIGIDSDTLDDIRSGRKTIDEICEEEEKNNA